MELFKHNINSNIAVTQSVGVGVVVDLSCIGIADLDRLDCITCVRLDSDGELIIVVSSLGLAFLDLEGDGAILALFSIGNLYSGQDSHFTMVSIGNSDIGGSAKGCLDLQAGGSRLGNGTGVGAILVLGHGNFNIPLVPAFLLVSNLGNAVTLVGSNSNNHFVLSSSTLTQRRYRSGSGRQLVAALLLVLINKALADAAVNIGSQSHGAIADAVDQIECMEATVAAQVSLLIAVVRIVMTTILCRAGNSLAAANCSISGPGGLCGNLTDVCTPQEFFVIIDAVVTDALGVVRIQILCFLGVNGCALLLIGHVSSKSRGIGVVGCQIDGNSGCCRHRVKHTANNCSLHFCLSHTTHQLLHVSITGLIIII